MTRSRRLCPSGSWLCQRTAQTEKCQIVSWPSMGSREGAGLCHAVHDSFPARCVSQGVSMATMWHSQHLHATTATAEVPFMRQHKPFSLPCMCFPHDPGVCLLPWRAHATLCHHSTNTNKSVSKKLMLRYAPRVVCRRGQSSSLQCSHPAAPSFPPRPMQLG